jgi:hypothetical protein
MVGPIKITEMQILKVGLQ